MAAQPKKPRRKSSPTKRPSSTQSTNTVLDDEEFIKTAGIIKKPGIPLGLRFLHFFSLAYCIM